MTIDQTTLSFLRSACRNEFGIEKGEKIFERSNQIYQELIQKTNDQDSKVIQEHLQLKLLSPMAYYKALQEEGFDNMDALEYVKKETHKAALIKKQEMEKLAKMPFAFTIYRLGVKNHMKKNFPIEGWDTEWVRCDAKEIHFNLYKCIYWDMAQQYKCPEICCVYCENDDIAFSGLLPKIKFMRSGTLGNGEKYCDFHFLRP